MKQMSKLGAPGGLRAEQFPPDTQPAVIAAFLVEQGIIGTGLWEAAEYEANQAMIRDAALGIDTTDPEEMGRALVMLRSMDPTNFDDRRYKRTHQKLLNKFAENPQLLISLLKNAAVAPEEGLSGQN
jgi:hypothetical protein